VPQGNSLAAYSRTRTINYVGLSKARRRLEELAKGAPETRLTREAKASLERLAKRRTAP
jgi:hypothetical protein